MAIEKQINIKVNTDQAVKNTEKLATSLNKVEQETKEVNKENENMKKSSQSLSGVIDKFTGGAISKMKAFKNSLGGVSTGFKGVGAAIAASGIGLLVVTIAAIVQAFKSSEEGQNKFAKLMGVIGSVVGNVTDVISDLGEVIIGILSGDSEAIKSATAFGRKIWDVVGLPIKNIIDIVKTAGKVLENLFSGDVDGALNALGDGVDDIKGNFNEAATAIDGARKSLKGFADEALREAKIASQIAEQRAKADKIDRGLIVEKAEAERRIAELRDKATRRDLYSLEERKAALIEASKINEEITEKEIKSAKIRRDAIIEENKLSKSNKEALDAEEQAKAKVIQLETARLNLQKRLGAELSSINEQQKAQSEAYAKQQKDLRDKEEKEKEDQRKKDQKAEQDRLKEISDFEKDLKRKDEDYYAQTEEEKLELERERAQKELDALVASEEEKREAQRLLNEYYDQLELDLETKRYEEKEKLRQQDAERQRKKEEEELKRKQALEQSKYELTKGTLGNIQDALDENSEAGKAFAAAQALINTYQGITAELATKTATPFEFGLKLVNIATTTAIGLKSVKDILSTNPKGVTSASGGGASQTAQTPSPSFNLVSGSGTNQIAESIAGERQPLRAYVVSGEMSTQQALDRSIEGNASI